MQKWRRLADKGWLLVTAVRFCLRFHLSQGVIGFLGVGPGLR